LAQHELNWRQDIQFRAETKTKTTGNQKNKSSFESNTKWKDIKHERALWHKVNGRIKTAHSVPGRVWVYICLLVEVSMTTHPTKEPSTHLEVQGGPPNHPPRIQPQCRHLSIATWANRHTRK